MKPKKESWILAGGALSAVLASICCIGPIVAMGLGLAGFVGAAWLVDARPYFMAAAFGSLAVAWYLVYRRPRVECATSAVSADRMSSRGSKILLWSGTALAVPAASFSWLVGGGQLSGGKDACCVREAGTTATLQPWESVDKAFAACAGACGTKASEHSAGIAVQPGVKPDQLTYCPVSGAVFKAAQASPRRDVGQTEFRFCCDGCAAYFALKRDQILAARGISIARTAN